MDNQAKLNDTKKKIIDACLDEFVENGLFKTSIRDLACALNMQSSGLYYYFKGKDEIVVACAEEAGVRMEDALLLPILNCIREDSSTVASKEMLKQVTPLMQFFAQVCTNKTYREKMQPVLNRLRERHAEYAVKYAEEFSCSPEEVAPYIYACVALVANYMIFQEEIYYKAPFELITSAVQTLKKRNKERISADSAKV